MKIGFVFWLLMLLWLLFGFWVFWPTQGGGLIHYGPLGGNLLLFILLGLLGWKCFGPPLQP